ncbi:hypothetical protein O4J56_22915 [Nocardiopsis sp. RSe5-2]|uniref:Uncharacterized protein n=1 Tax=Nocardiopsis endophytica TaxID=3018445 RepID=A0ABT4U9V7_9ACTN|nr:hypothetical protein [Nocardiopsis endophytica]MDA2813516.1 hypothetical protein [Nocardiopsis endophytica]
MTPYLGSGPYCYASSIGMVLGERAPAGHVIETLTGSPFGVQLIEGRRPFFDPLGWDPEAGVAAALGLLGVSYERTGGGTPEEALARLRAACARGPVIAGPLDMGLLTHHPGERGPDGGDHYVVVLSADDGTVVLHDPHGFPYAALPAPDFVRAWRADAVEYADTPFTMRSDFASTGPVSAGEALVRSLPRALEWLDARGEGAAPVGSLGGAGAVEALAALVRSGLAPDTRVLLEVFGVRVGARRLSDAARCLAEVGLDAPAAVAAEQARLLGAVQYPLSRGDDPGLEAALRRLAPTYPRLRDALAQALHGLPARR